MNFQEYLQHQLDTDPEFRREWEAGEPAAQVVRALVGCRSRNQWTQKELARRMGVSKTVVARVEETGEATPEFMERFQEVCHSTLGQ